jgi:serine/threonine-protein kinase RsbT
LAVEGTSGAIPIRSEEDIVASRQLVRTLARAMHFSLVDQTKTITAVSELSRNTLVHGGGGEMRWERLERGGRAGLRVSFEDQGPGIADTQLAMTDGWTSGNGMGLGLPGSRRLVNEFEIDSAPGRGTRVSIVKWK